MNAAADLFNKLDVARSFGRAAGTYDDAANLQKRVCNALASWLPEDDSIGHCLDLGCGTGLSTRELELRYPGACHLGLDFAEGMLAFAAARGHARGAHWVGGDAERLPLCGQSFDLVFSNLSLQWCRDLQTAASEAFRVLRPGGHLLFSTLGPATLGELRGAWQQVDKHVHVNNFLATDQIRQALLISGLQVELLESSRIVMPYRRFTELARDLKSIGAHNVNHGRATGLTGRKRIRALEAAYEVHRDSEGKLPATYEAVYVLARKP